MRVEGAGSTPCSGQCLLSDVLRLDRITDDRFREPVDRVLEPMYERPFRPGVIAGCRDNQCLIGRVFVRIWPISAISFL